MAAEGVAHHLMAETDADVGYLAGLNFARQFREFMDPGLIVIDAGFGSGGDIGVAFIEVLRSFALLEIVDCPIGRQRVGEQPRAVDDRDYLGCSGDCKGTAGK